MADVIIFIQYWTFLVVSFWMIILRLYFHPILDVSCDPSLDDNLRLYFHPILDVSCRQFLDDNFTLVFSSNIGCFL